MEQEMLEKLKAEYNDISKMLSNNFEEIVELEKNPIIIRYNYLKSIQNSAERCDYYNSDDYKKKYFLDLCIKKYGISWQTNNIYVFMFECTQKRLEDLLHQTLSLSKDSKDNVVVYYVDIENPSKYLIIKKEEQEEFEKTHKVIIGKNSIYDSYDRYYNVRREFFASCIEDGQEQAVKLVLTKYPKNRN